MARVASPHLGAQWLQPRTCAVASEGKLLASSHLLEGTINASNRAAGRSDWCCMFINAWRTRNQPLRVKHLASPVWLDVTSRTSSPYAEWTGVSSGKRYNVV